MHRRGRGRSSWREVAGGLQGEPCQPAPRPPQLPQALGLPGGPGWGELWSPGPRCPPTNLGLLGGGWVRACKGHSEALGPRDRGKAAAPALHWGGSPGVASGWQFWTQRSSPPSSLSPLHPPPPHHQHQGSLSFPHPGSSETCSSLLPGRQRPVHPEACTPCPSPRSSPGSEPSFLPLQRPTHPVERLWGGTLGHPASSHRLRGSSRGGRRSHLGGEETRAGRSFLNRKELGLSLPNTLEPILSQCQCTAGVGRAREGFGQDRRAWTCGSLSRAGRAVGNDHLRWPHQGSEWRWTFRR